jgi:tripartite-type tricarboxylate transporter receptor subunit TctC
MLKILPALAASLWAAVACAQDYPSRPVRMLSMYAGGSATDASARFMAQELAKQLKQPVLVENKPGGGGLVAAQEALRAQPLGYTILYAAPVLIGNLYAYRNPGYKLEDFTLLGAVGLTNYALIIHNSVPAKNLKEFIAYAKAHPGKLNYASVGPASGGTLLAERLKLAAGIDLVAIPYKGGDAVSTALLAGDVHAYFAAINVARIRMRSPQITGLAAIGEQRAKLLPDVPTFKELGFPTLVGGAFWDAVFASAAVPAAMTQRLRGAVAAATATPEMKDRLEKTEKEPWNGTMEQFQAFLRSESDALAADVKRLKIEPQD